MDVPEEVVEFTRSTASNFHSKVVKTFRAKGWHTRVSPYYLDGATNRAREIDLIAERFWNPFGLPGKLSLRLHTKLFVECKYVSENTVFWFDEKDSAAARRWLVENTPLPNPDNAYTARHHYVAGEPMVAKLFETKARSTEREYMYKALNQALHSMVYLRRKGSIIPAERLDHRPSFVVEYPVIVVNSFEKFFRVNMGNLNEVTPIDANFLLEVNYAFLDASKKDRNEYFLIDVVSLDRIDAFFEGLGSDVEAMTPSLAVLPV